METLTACCVRWVGERMRYSERFGEGLLGAILTSAVVAVGAAFLAMIALVPWLRVQLLPAAGTAPPREALEAASFSCTCFALSEEESAGTPVRVKARLEVRVFMCMHAPLHACKLMHVSSRVYVARARVFQPLEGLTEQPGQNT